MPQVITGFDRFAQNQRQRKLDERTATLQDAQESRAVAQEGRAVSAFEMAKQATVKADARQVKLDAQADEDRATGKAKDALAIRKLQNDVFVGAYDTQLMFKDPVPLTDANMPLWVLTGYDEPAPEGATVQTQYDSKGLPSSFLFKKDPDDPGKSIGLHDPAVTEAYLKQLASGGMERHGAGSPIRQADGSYAWFQPSLTGGAPKVTPLAGTPASETNAVADSKTQWQLVGPEIMAGLPPGSAGLIDGGLKFKDPIEATATLLALRDEITLDTTKDPETAKNEYNAAQTAIATALEKVSEFNRGTAATPAPTKPDATSVIKTGKPPLRFDLSSASR